MMPLSSGHISVDAHRKEKACQVGAVCENIERLLRIFESHQAGFDQGIDTDNLAAVAHRLLQFGQHAGMARAGVLTDDEDGVGAGQSLRW